MITTLYPDDVLLGRGSCINEYVGNQRFRDLIDERKAEYKAHSQFEPKQKIARSIMDRIHARGGRFLRLTREENDPFVFEESVWEICDEPSAIEKIKQGLRQKSREASKRKDESRKRFQQSGTGISPLTGSASVSPTVATDGLSVTSSGDPTFHPFHQATPVPSFSTSTSIFPPSLFPAFSLTSATSFVGPSPTGSLFQPAPIALHPSRIEQSIQNVDCVIATLSSQLSSETAARSMPDLALSRYPSLRILQERVPAVHGSTVLPSQASISVANKSAPETEERDEAPKEDRNKTVNVASMPLEEDQQSGIIKSDKEASEYLLSILALSGRAKFTEQDVALESATLTDADKAEALSDLFGRRCSIDTHKTKKPKRDLDKESIDFLVKQMRVEIEAVPAKEKQALLEAQAKCAAEEFSDARLEKFLRCEGMNTKLAAKRFVNYWSARLEVFGKERFVQRMTLSEALRDDLKAIETGVQWILPSIDESGRPIIFYNPTRHSREGYSSESLLRALWYGLEVVAEGNTDVHNSYVEVVWNKDSSIFDYDKVYERVTCFRDSAFPVKTASIHVCCSSKFVLNLIKPVLWAFKTKQSRARSIFHSASESEIMGVLATYGIQRSMLPSEMPGGTLEFNHQEWIAQRRAAEMEELS